MEAATIAETSRLLITCLQDDLYVSDVGLVDGLIEEGYLSSNDWQAIHGVHRHKKKVKILIKCLAKSHCPYGAFRCLLDKLSISHTHLIPAVSRILKRFEEVGNPLADDHCKAVENEDITNESNVASLNEERCRNHYVKLDNKSENQKKYIGVSRIRKGCQHFETLRNGNKNSETVDRYPLPETGHYQNGHVQEATENSWHSNTDTNGNRRVQLIQTTKELLSCSTSERPCRDECSSKNNRTGASRARTADENAESIQRSGVEHSYYGFDEVDAVCFPLDTLNLSHSDNNGQVLEIRRTPKADTVPAKPDSEPVIIQINGDGYSSQHITDTTEEIDVEIQPKINPSNVVETSCESVRNSMACSCCDSSIDQSFVRNTKALTRNRKCFNSHISVKGDCSDSSEENDIVASFSKGNRISEDCCTNNLSADSKPLKNHEDSCHKMPVNITYDDQEKQESNHCRNCNKLRKNASGRKCDRREVIARINRKYPMNCTRSSKTKIVLSLSSSSDTDSEVNTEVLTSDLDEDELLLFGAIDSGDISDVIDVCIESGVLSSDDYNLIHGTSSNRRKSAILARLLSQNAKKCVSGSNGLEHFNTEFGPNEDCGMDEVDAKSVHTQDTDNAALLRALHILPSSGQTIIKDLDVVFDKFNTMLNNGMLKVDELPENPNVRCIVYFLQACDNLYLFNFEVAKKHIKAIDAVLPNTDYPVQLRSDVFTAKTWLCLRTNKLGKMLRLLEENEQYIKSFPDHWSSKAKGWFYYDFGRCYEAMLIGALFHGIRKDNENITYLYRQRAVTSLKRAVDFFRTSDSSDGPIGCGFAWCQLADLHLLCYSRTSVTDIDICEQDLQIAKAAIADIEKLPGGILDVLKSNYLVTKCRFMIRIGDLFEAAQLAHEAAELSERLQLKLEIKECNFLLNYIDHLNGGNLDFNRGFENTDESSPEISDSE